MAAASITTKELGLLSPTKYVDFRLNLPVVVLAAWALTRLSPGFCRPFPHCGRQQIPEALRFDTSDQVRHGRSERVSRLLDVPGMPPRAGTGGEPGGSARRTTGRS